jgi:pilus assembly protein Flp/PilA
MIARFASDRRGATAIEYAVISAIITVVIIASLTAMGTSLTGMLNAVSAGFGGG